MRRSLLAVGLATSLLAACGDDSGSTDSAATAAVDASTAPGSTASTGGAATSTAAPSGSVEPAPGAAGAPNAAAAEALQFSAPLVGGGSIDFTQYAGTTVALWFWAPT